MLYAATVKKNTSILLKKVFCLQTTYKLSTVSNN